MNIVKYIRRPLGFFRRILLLFFNFSVDAWRFARHSQMFRYGNACADMQYQIIALAHVLEKGLSLSDPRLGFGVAVRGELLANLKLYKARGYPVDHMSYRMGCAVLGAYIAFHHQRGFDLGVFEADAKDVHTVHEGVGGFRDVKADVLRSAAQGNFAQMAATRHSIRHYDKRPVGPELISEAIDIARQTPSVCNRQSWTVYVVRDADLKSDLMKLQGGGRGFGEQASTVLIVASDLRSFFGIAERNEAYVDGGLFSMSLMYALHYKGLGACPLNWCVDVMKDRRLKKLVSIPDNMTVIMLISVGHLPDLLRVAQSVRKDINTFVEIRPA